PASGEPSRFRRIERCLLLAEPSGRVALQTVDKAGWSTTLTRLESDCNGIRGRSQPPGAGRELDSLATGVRPLAGGDPRREARAGYRARRGRPGRAAGCEPGPAPRGDRSPGDGGARHRA